MCQHIIILPYFTAYHTRQIATIVRDSSKSWLESISLFVESLREDYDWLAESLEDEATSRQYEIDSSNLAKSIDTFGYENNFQEENLKVWGFRGFHKEGVVAVY